LCSENDPVIRFCRPVKIRTGRKKPKIALDPYKAQRLMEVFDPINCNIEACAERFGISPRAVSRLLSEAKHPKFATHAKPRFRTNPGDRIRLFAKLFHADMDEETIRKKLKVKKDTQYSSLLQRAMDEGLI
jgi:predicted DNA-binding protein (UPF0251 family)